MLRAPVAAAGSTSSVVGETQLASIETPEMLSWRRLRRALDEFAMPGTLLGFVTDTYGPRLSRKPGRNFPAQMRRSILTPHTFKFFMPWFFHCWSPDPHGTSIADATLHESS